MRISSNTLFDSGAAAMIQQQSRLQQTQQQVASGRKILSASDDPVASARALDISEADSMNVQYATNRNAAHYTLSTAETNLQSVTDLILDMRDAAISAGNPSLTDSARQGIAADLNGKLQGLVGLANGTDGLGNYLFSGFQSKTQPFVDTAAGVVYMGDDGQRQVQVSASRQMPSSDSGADIFMRIKNGNGTFVTQATPANSGTGSVSVGNVTNSTLLTGHNYQIDFISATTYKVTDTTTSVVLTPPGGNPYVSGQAISFDGMQFDIAGAPALGDSFTVKPSTSQSLFATVSSMITALNTPTTSANVAAQSGEAMIHSIKNLDNALEKVMTVRASLGVRLNEVDALQSAGDDLDIQFKKSLSELQDLDYSKALTDLSMQQMILQAAQQSFTKVSDLSMFKYL